MELESTENPGRFFSALTRELKSIAHSNIQYFENGKQSHHAQFHVSFKLLYEYIDVGIEPTYKELSKHVHLFDFSPSVKGNGYRSLLRVVQKCCLHLLQLTRYISTVRDAILFRKRVYAKELESYVAALGQLRAVLYYALKLINYSQDGQLFADENQLNKEIAESLLLEVEGLSQESFFGRCLGFQFCDSMHKPLQALAIAMASYSEGYLETSQMMQVASSVFNSGKYFLDPELRAQQIVKVTRTADIKFCKAFWGFSESGLMHQLPSFVCPAVEVNEIITLGPDAFELPLVDGSDTVIITPPCAHTGPGHVQVRLISARLIEGQQAFKKIVKSKTPAEPKPRTSSLVIHIHGGGFVAQSSKSHEVYLRHWAISLETPILSIDYSLAPELPFPRALEDCFYAYAWAVKECERLGSTGEKIIMVGDSAGANLVISTAMRAASFGIRRPDGIVAVYPSTLIKYTPSPARLLSLLDPVLPMGLVSRCLAAYAGINEEHPLATPQTDDVHSQQSLSSLQVKSYETTNKDDWIIVADDEDEANDIRTRATMPSPEASCIGKSVIDSLEDSYSEDSAPSSPAKNPILGKAGKSDTVDSEDVIFSRLQEEGSCVLHSGSDKCDAKKSSEAGFSMASLNPSSTQDGTKSRQPFGAGSSNFSLFQEKAKTMMEGAQSMFTNLSSYIPSSQDFKAPKMMGSFSTLLPTSSSVMTEGSQDLICDREVPSNSVDDTAMTDLTHSCASGEVGKGDSRTETPMDESKDASGMDQEEFEDLADLFEKNVSGQNEHQERLPQPSASDGDNVANATAMAELLGTTSCPSLASSDQVVLTGSLPEEQVILRDPGNSIDSQMVEPHFFIKNTSHMGHAQDSTVKNTKENVITLNSLPRQDTADSGHESNQEMFSPSSSIPSSTSTQEGFTTAATTPASAIGQPVGHLTSPEVTTAKLGSEKPIVGFSPLAENVTGRDSVDDENVTNAGSGDINSTNQGSTQDCSNEITVGIPVLSEDVDFDAISPQSLPSLPDESKDLLEDALTVDNTSAGQEAEAEGQSKEFDPSQDSADITGSLSPTKKAVKQISDSALCIPDSKNTDFPLKSISHPLQEELAPGPSSHPHPNPPTSLSLKHTTHTATSCTGSSTSPSQLFKSDEKVDMFDLGGDVAPSFDESRLQLDFTSAGSNVDPPTSPEVKGIFRSESAPVISSMMSPSQQNVPGTSTRHRGKKMAKDMSNGLTTGMSPSDFKRQSFTAQSPLHRLRKAPVVENPYMSPLLATEELLVGLPKVCIVACHLDPLLDDGVMFACKLRDLNLSVELNLIDDLPHGFLNFSLLSNEAKRASDFCCQKIFDML